MAVRAEQAKVLQTVVIPVAVDVVELQGGGFALPRDTPTTTTTVWQDLLVDEPLLQHRRSDSPS
jgi:hypothetical protein